MADTKIVGGKGVVRGSGGGGGGEGEGGGHHHRHREAECPVCQVGEGALGKPFWPHYAKEVGDAESVLRTIFVRPNGSDSHGKGTEHHPFRTLVHAVRVVPPTLPQNTVYRIDITGIDEQLPTDYVLPEWKSWAVSEDPPPNAITNFQAAVEIYATPQPVPTMPLADTIIEAIDVASVTADPLTGLHTINLLVPRASWTTANLKGAQVSNPSNEVFTSVVAQVNSTSSILITTTGAPSFPLSIVRPSAHLHGAGTFWGTIRAINIDSIGFTGIKITSDNGFNGLLADGSGTCIAQLCELDSPFVAQQSGSQFDTNANRVLRSWVYNFPTFSGVVGVVQCLVDQATPVSNFDSPFFTAPTTVVIRQSVFSGCDPIEVAVYEPGGNIDGAGTAHILVQNTLVTGGIADGFVFHGVKGHVTNCDFAGNAGNGITVEGGGGQLTLENVGSSAPNGGFGVAITDGMQVAADVATTTNATLLAGSSGQIQLGVATVGWATVAAPPNNVADFTGPTATGARISQQ